MSYWPQQVNFAVWCETTGCGISREILDKDYSTLGFLAQVYSFYHFHVYFTVRRILYHLGGIQSISALPGDPTFSQANNKYDVASYKRICTEFIGINPSSDFRLTKGANHGLGSVYIYVSYSGPEKNEYDYPGSNKFSDESGSEFKGNLIYYIYRDPYAEAQADWFCPNGGEGLTQAGLSPINQSIVAFVYCVLGSQVNVRSSILGSGGRAKEAQSEFLALVEDAIRQPDLAASIQRYQLAVDEAKVKAQPCCVSRCLADDRADGDQHRERGGIQQQAQASWGRNEARDQQRSEHEHKKSGPSTHGRGEIKNEPAKQPSIKPDSQGRNKQKRPAVQTAAEPTPAVQTQLEPPAVRHMKTTK